MKTLLVGFLALLAVLSPAYSQSKSASATMYQDTGMQKDGYGTVYHTFNIWYGTVTDSGVFTVSSKTKRYEAKPGSEEEAFMRAASGYNAWCVVPSYELRSMGVQAAKVIKQGSTAYGAFRVTSVR